MVDLIQKYFPGLTDQQNEQFAALQSLYSYWNIQINVISRKDMDFLYLHHVLHSLGIAKSIHFVQGSQVLDVGTGGGFPGIPLAILFPQVTFTLVDSIGKKIKVVQAVADELGLSNVVSFHSRVEALNSKFDFIVSRAVTSIPEFIRLVAGKLKEESVNEMKNGVLYLKGGDFLDELAKIGYPFMIFELKEYYQEDYFETKKVVYIQLSKGRG